MIDGLTYRLVDWLIHWLIDSGKGPKLRQFLCEASSNRERIWEGRPNFLLRLLLIKNDKFKCKLGLKIWI